MKPRFGNIEKISYPNDIATRVLHPHVFPREETVGCMTWVKHRENGTGRRKRKHKAKAAKYMAVNLPTSSCPVLHMICCNGKESSQMVEKEDCDSVMMKEDLIERNFATMMSMLHIRGLRKPLGMGTINFRYERRALE